MDTISFVARAGNRILNLMVAMFVVVAMSYSGYALWDTYNVYRGAFPNGELLKFKPSGQPGEDNPTLEELMAINQDVLGWLVIDDTHIDYPLLQGENDMEYVNKDLYGEFSLSGAIFLAAQNKRDFSDRYNLIYGHHMDNGAMFGDIMEFLNEGYFDEHRTGTLYLPDTTCKVELWACLETNAYDDHIFILADKQSEAGFSEFIDFVKNNALHIHEDMEVTSDDRIIAMSTCVDASTNGRAVMLGRLVP